MRLLAVVFGAMVLAFVAAVALVLIDVATDSTVRSPKIGDHWHAPYAVYIGAEVQPNAPRWESGIHTHGDGIIHIHPFTADEQGSNATLARWFANGGGELTMATLRIPGDAAIHRAGDPVPGRDFAQGGGSIYIFANDEPVEPDYIPQDGDYIVIRFDTEAGLSAPTAMVTPIATVTPQP